MNSKSKVLALKYRPQTFDQVVGQKIISESIYNSIKNNKVPNAYLFLGIRGTGKTSLARIVAKALNCEKGAENLCSKEFCSSCQSIIDGNNIDIIEVDGASSTSVNKSPSNCHHGTISIAVNGLASGPSALLAHAFIQSASPETITGTCLDWSLL